MQRLDSAIGIGFVGAGMVGQVAHLANYAALDGCRVAALAELRPELARMAAAKFGIVKVYADHRDLLNDPEVQAVVVVTRPQAHGPIVLDALEAGRHVLSEKPMAHTFEHAARLVDAAERRCLRYAVGFMKRHDAGAQKAKTMLDELRRTGNLGRVLLVRAWCFGGEFRCDPADFVMTGEVRSDGLSTWPKAPAWMPVDRAEDYAAFLNVFIHDLNMLRFLVGAEPVVRAADLRRRNGRVAMLDFGEFPAVLEMSEIPTQQWDEGVEVLFERGRLKLTFPSPMARNVSARVELSAEGKTVASEVAPGWAFRRQAEAFVADIRDGRAPLADGRDSLADLTLAEAIWRTGLGLS